MTVLKPRLFLRDHPPRAIKLKACVSSAFLIGLLLEPQWAVSLALAANLLWLWVDFE